MYCWSHTVALFSTQKLAQTLAQPHWRHWRDNKTAALASL